MTFSSVTLKAKIAIIFIAIFALIAPAQAADAAAVWPTHPVKLIVGFPAGSSPDLTARALATPLSQALGQPVIVDNKIGAGGNIGAGAVARAKDGHTIGLFINGNLTTAKLLNPALPYDPLTDLQPVSLIGTAPLVLVAPAKTTADARLWLAQLRAQGDRASYGSPGIGTVGHLGMEWLKARTGLLAVHVPYPGYPQVFNALQSGDLQLALLPPALAQAQIKGGKLRGIGITSSGRSVLVPDLPSLADVGIKDFNLSIWNAVAAPASMPRAQVQKLATALQRIVREPTMRQQLFVQGWQTVGSTPEVLAARIQSDAANMGAVIRAQKIAAQ